MQGYKLRNMLSADGRETKTKLHALPNFLGVVSMAAGFYCIYINKARAQRTRDRPAVQPNWPRTSSVTFEPASHRPSHLTGWTLTQAGGMGQAALLHDARQGGRDGGRHHDHGADRELAVKPGVLEEFQHIPSIKEKGSA